jgi:RHS repeat-associated protein
MTLLPDRDKDATVTFNTGATDGTLGLMATATGASDDGSYVVTVQPPQVTPDGAARLVAPTVGARLSFNVRNSSTGQRTFNLTSGCTGIVIACGAPSPSSVTLPGGQSADAWITFSTSGAGLTSGVLTLTATEPGSSLSDAGTYALTLAPTGPVVARDLCLTIAAGAGAAYECGDLRLVHVLPAVRTLNKARAPVLLYNSQHAHPYPLVSADVTVPAGALPDSVRATLTVNAVAYNRTWAGSAWGSGGQTRRVVVGFDAINAGLATSVYAYQLTITKFVGGSGTTLQQSTGSLPIVRRDSSAFGPGWWIAGYERLLFTGLPAGQVLWVGGDGSAALYERGGAIGTDTAYLASLVDRPDTLLHTSANEWKRLLTGGDTVVFSSAGVHVRTANRLGYRTLFTDSSGLLVRIEVPADTSLRYRFTYAGSPARLTQVTIPDSGAGTSRVTSLAWAGDSVRITDPGTTAPITFRYQAGGTNRMQSRTSRRGAVTRFIYNTAFRLDSANVALGGPDSINLSFCAAEVRGLAVCSPTLLAPESVYTRFDGPRVLPDSADYMDFWVDGLGATWKARDPYGSVTTLTKGDLSGSALVTRVQYANGRIVGATYDLRGNLATSTDSSLYTPGQHATTRYQWDQRWDDVTEVIAPTGEVNHFGYDPANGNRLWQEDGRGAPSRVSFAYYTIGNGTGLVKTVMDPTGAKDSVAYDTRGNVIYSRTPLGYVTTSLLDRLGRPRVVSSPVSGVTRDDSTSYDQRSLPLRTVAFGRAVNGVLDQSVIVQNFYNANGQPDSLQRLTNPDPANVGTITTRWRYDLVGRVVAEVSPDLQRDSTRYDPTGNAIAVVTRRGDTLTTSYDRLNRVRRRIVPQVKYYARCQGLATVSNPIEGLQPYPWISDQYPGTWPYQDCANDGSGYHVSDSTQWTLTLAADTASFSYGPMGELLTADNRSAKIKRTYFRDGRIETDTLRINAWTAGDPTIHNYGISYRYDLSGRLTWLRHPWALAPRMGGVVKDTARYEYDPVIGALSAVVDPLDNRFEYTYNFRNERIRLKLPGGITDTTSYDTDGRVVLERIRNQSSSQWKSLQLILRKRTTQYVDALRAAQVWDSAGWRDTTTLTYSGLGHAVRSLRRAPVKNDIDTAQATSDEQIQLDPMGNAYSTTYSGTLGSNVLWMSSGSSYSPRYAPLSGAQPTGRLRGATLVSPNQTRVDTTLYDPAGNVAFSYQTTQTGAREDRAYFYAADGTLRASEYRSRWPWQMVYDQYRYDALGRRVVVRTQRATEMPHGCGLYQGNWGSLRRTVWNGNAELYEVQTYGGKVCAGWAEDGPYLENDTLPLAIMGSFEWLDIGTNFGRVAYTAGPALDQPLSAIRINFTDTVPVPNKPRIVWDPITIVPHWTWRGQADYGTLADGGLKTCRTEDQQRCALRVWDAQGFLFAQQPANAANGWWGSLLRYNEDATGTLYRRNRYVDPGTGRFTQEDPIGLAGGLNLYGFANGDPINFGDPFGLCPWTGGTRDRNLSDCPKDSKGNEDKRTGAFRLLMADGGREGTETANYVINKSVNIQLTSGLVNCGGANVQACSPSRTETRINGLRSPSSIAARLVHEVTHMSGTMTGGPSREEATAHDRALNFYDRLPAPLRTATDLNRWSRWRVANPTGLFNANCTGSWTTPCPP